MDRNTERPSLACPTDVGRDRRLRVRQATLTGSSQILALTVRNREANPAVPGQERAPGSRICLPDTRHWICAPVAYDYAPLMPDLCAECY